MSSRKSSSIELVMITKGKTKLLLVDDDSVYLAAAKRFLTRDGLFEAKTVETAEAALVEIKSQAFDMVLLDVNLHTPAAGFACLERIRELDPQLKVVMLSGEKDFHIVRQAIQTGALDYIPKDSAPDELVYSIQRALEKGELKKFMAQRNFEVAVDQKKHSLVGSSAVMEELRSLIQRARRTNFNVIITGETGTGKEVVARHLRGESDKGEWLPFVAVDSSTIQSTTAESQLFGHEKGAFTGADKQRRGLFEEADGGIIYFDEIENMPLDIQGKLLRVVQEQEVTRFGSTKPISLEFRVVCATNKHLPEMVKDGKFKEDLYQRLNVIPIRVPSLREHAEDIPELVEFFSKKHSFDGKQIELSDEALDAFMAYSWPGNVRELGNVIAFLTAMRDDPYIELEDLPLEIRSPGRGEIKVPAGVVEINDANYYRRMAQYEKSVLEAEYRLAQGNISRLAQRLGLDRSTLYSKLGMHGIHKKKSPVNADDPALVESISTPQ